MAERVSRWRAELPQGTGPYRVVRLIEPDFTEHTVYRPADMRRAGKLPIIAFANGACRNTSTEYAAFLSELASHGYLVIAVGRDDQPFDLGPNAPKTSPDGRLMQVIDEKVMVAGGGLGHRPQCGCAAAPTTAGCARIASPTWVIPAAACRR